jgi:crotonobetainyl-CoA:carnitine CoA-transferase CaiB-like acyl-CoA transferase
MSSRVVVALLVVWVAVLAATSGVLALALCTGRAPAREARIAGALCAGSWLALAVAAALAYRWTRGDDR